MNDVDTENSHTNYKPYYSFESARQNIKKAKTSFDENPFIF